MAGMGAPFNPMSTQMRLDNNEFHFNTNTYNRVPDLSRHQVRYDREYMPSFEHRNITRNFDYNSDNSDEEGKGMNFRLDDKLMHPYSSMMRPNENFQIKQNFIPENSEMANRMIRQNMMHSHRNIGDLRENQNSKPGLAYQTKY